MEQDTIPESPIPLLALPANDIVHVIVSANMPTKALLLAVQTDPTPIISILQQLQPEMVCFFLHESAKHLVESDVHPALSHMPKRWDWILTTDTESFPTCHKTLAQELGPLLTTWNVTPGELAIDLTVKVLGGKLARQGDHTWPPPTGSARAKPTERPKPDLPSFAVRSAMDLSPCFAANLDHCCQ